ncbi:tyrosine-protein phosphatase [Cognatishimia sp. SS12]|uniref:phosphatase domain-containing protein n=1 Tax=Cognatishimia sp. SS12 TaxID=2979465 RepID=UPI00232B1F31|nr:tyrosine-protein phosphatase [Cognatishimia sp. SS12]MDC0738711.1 tyrosine-protein phosphatase [Cognatishimia sp. SS12]
MFEKLVSEISGKLRARRKRPRHFDLSTAEGRRAAMRHFNWTDHGILRVFWTNTEALAPGVYRANQPSPKRIAQYAKMGIHTILSLRGTSRSSHALLEEESCAKHGIRLITLELSARSAAPRSELLALLDHFDTLKPGYVIHCKSGADRTGLAAAFYLLHVQNRPLEEARKHLALRYVHLHWTKAGILDHILDCYAADMRKQGDMPLRQWLAQHYDPDEITRSFHAKRGTA